MKLQQLTERAMRALFHMTRVDFAAQILTTGQFKLTPATGARDGRNMTHAPTHYFLSMARSIQSGYIVDMITPAAVIFAIDGAVLTQKHKVRPHVDQDSKDWFMDNYDEVYDEMEERLVSSKPVLKLQPLNRAITSVHMMDLNDQAILRQATHGSESDASPEGFQQIQAACKQHGIPLQLYKDFAKFKLLRGG